MCMSKPKAPPPIAVPAPVKAADTAVSEARAAERRRTGGTMGNAATDVTKGALAEASTNRKTALGA